MDPVSKSRRSFVYRELAAAGAMFDAVADGAVAMHYGDPDGAVETARRLGLLDLSVLPRGGFKGAGTVQWLATQGVSIPEINAAAAQRDGCLAARLGPEEVLFLSGLDGTCRLVDRLDAAWAKADGDSQRGYPVPRRETHAWFLVTGERAADLFAKLCAVDLRPQSFANQRIAQTSVARANAIVIRSDVAGMLAYNLLADSAAADYYLRVLLDAATEFAGSLVGFQSLQALLR